MQKFGLTLGGGGARGLAHIGYLEVLDALRLSPVVVSGCSMGAVIGALYAAGTNGADIRILFEECLPHRGGTLRSAGLRLRSLVRNLARLGPELRHGGLVNVDSLVDSLLAPLDGCTFADLPIPLVVVATDFWSGKGVVIEKGPLLPAIKASMAVPGLIRPGEIDDQVLVDGGLTNVLPYGPLLDRCDITIAIDVSGERRPDGGQIPNSMDASSGAIQILQCALLREQLRHSAPDLLVRPALRNIGLLDFAKADEIFVQSHPSWDDFPNRLARLGLIMQQPAP
ncbi:patatin-like phospholipase family protein [bacterium]|nr:patatin-like phospholipase family protein [bacterium]